MSNDGAVMSRGARLGLMAAGGFALALPVGLLMTPFHEDSPVRNLLAAVWLVGFIAWCMYVSRRWKVPPKHKPQAGGFVPGGDALAPVVAMPVSDSRAHEGPSSWGLCEALPPVPIGSGGASNTMLYLDSPLPKPGWYRLEARKVGRLPGWDEPHVGLFHEGSLVASTTPFWLKRFHREFPGYVSVEVGTERADVYWPADWVARETAFYTNVSVKNARSYQDQLSVLAPGVPLPVELKRQGKSYAVRVNGTRIGTVPLDSVAFPHSPHVVYVRPSKFGEGQLFASLRSAPRGT